MVAFLGSSGGAKRPILRLSFRCLLIYLFPPLGSAGLFEDLSERHPSRARSDQI